MLAAIAALLIGVVSATPFLFTTHLARVVLRQVFPSNNPTLGDATLRPSGTVVLRDLKLFDTGSLSNQPLVVIGEVDARFSWHQLLSRTIRAIHASDVTVYVRTRGSAQISLLDSFLPKHPSSGPPLWVGTIEAQGRINVEPIPGFAQAQTKLPLSFHMAMSGARESPSRSLKLSLGNTRGLAADGSMNPRADETTGTFGILADIDTQPAGAGTSVKMHRIAANNAALTIGFDSLRNYLVRLPPGLKGNIETGLASLRLSGELVIGGGPSQNQIHGEIEFKDLRVRVPKSPEFMLNVENISGAAKVDRSLAEDGTTVTVEQLRSGAVKASIAADLIGHYAKSHLSLTGRIEGGFENLQMSGQLSQSINPAHNKLHCNIAFSGLHLLVPGRPRPILSIADLSSAAKIVSALPPDNSTTIAIDSVSASNVTATVDADTVRQYVTKLPADLHGLIDASLAALSVSGDVGPRGREATGFDGDIRIQDLSVASSPSQQHSFALDDLTIAGKLESPLNRWKPEALKARGGVLKFAGLTYGSNGVNDFDASWQINGHVLSADHLSAKMFEGHVSDAPAFDLVTHAMPPRDFLIKSIDMHKALANLSPDRIDAEGKASGIAHLERSAQGDLSGSLSLHFDGPGVLKIGQVEEVKQMLEGNFGLSMANLAMHDLQHYPFTEGAISLESLGSNSLLKIKFVRQARSEADVRTPHKEIINGREVMVGSLVVPVIDMTIPITGKSLAEILSMVSGVHPDDPSRWNATDKVRRENETYATGFYRGIDSFDRDTGVPSNQE